MFRVMGSVSVPPTQSFIRTEYIISVCCLSCHLTQTAIGSSFANGFLPSILTNGLGPTHSGIQAPIDQSRLWKLHCHNVNSHHVFARQALQLLVLQFDFVSKSMLLSLEQEAFLLLLCMVSAAHNFRVRHVNYDRMQHSTFM